MQSSRAAKRSARSSSSDALRARNRTFFLSRVRQSLGLERDDGSPWREFTHWKAEARDVATVDVGTLDEALVWEAPRREDLDLMLRSHLVRLAEEWTRGGRRERS